MPGIKPGMTVERLRRSSSIGSPGSCCKSRAARFAQVDPNLDFTHRSSERLLQPEMILAGERIGMRGLVAVPAVELALVRILVLHFVLAARIHHEADEREPIVGQEGLDLR